MLSINFAASEYSYILKSWFVIYKHMINERKNVCIILRKEGSNKQTNGGCIRDYDCFTTAVQLLHNCFTY